MARARPALLSAAAQGLLTLAIPRCQGCSFIVANFNLTTHDESSALAVANWYNRRRGPDATRHRVHKGWSFVHNLLSMTGTFTTQPFVETTGDVVAVFNGEIYNYQELATRLEQPPFASDGHAILPAYARWGAGFVHRLHGEFAIVLVDFKRRHVVLSADVFGTKPLYYARTTSGDFLAASYRSVLAALLPRAEVSRIQAAVPNEALVLGMDGTVHSRRTLFTFDLRQHKQHTNDWEAAFLKAVRVRTANIKHRIFIGMSSGYDSGAIALALHQQGTKFMSYTVTANENVTGVIAQRERHFARTGEGVHLTTPHHALFKSGRWLLNRCEPASLSQNRAGFDMPCLDRAAWALSIILSHSRSLGGLIYLSGSGADEIISDYVDARGHAHAGGCFKGVFPANLSTIFPWCNFYQGSQRQYLMKEEFTSGTHGVEGRYPFLDPHVVQEFLWLSREVKNSEYKRPLADFMRKHGFPFETGIKRGWAPDSGGRGHLATVQLSNGSHHVLPLANVSLDDTEVCPVPVRTVKFKYFAWDVCGPRASMLPSNPPAAALA